MRTCDKIILVIFREATLLDQLLFNCQKLAIIFLKQENRPSEIENKITSQKFFLFASC